MESVDGHVYSTERVTEVGEFGKLGAVGGDSVSRRPLRQETEGRIGFPRRGKTGANNLLILSRISVLKRSHHPQSSSSSTGVAVLVRTRAL